MKHQDYDTSYGLEHKLAQSVEKVKSNVTRSNALKKEIIKLRKQRRQADQYPQDVVDWFKEVEEGEEEDE